MNSGWAICHHDYDRANTGYQRRQTHAIPRRVRLLLLVRRSADFLASNRPMPQWLGACHLEAKGVWGIIRHRPEDHLDKVNLPDEAEAAIKPRRSLEEPLTRFSSRSSIPAARPCCARPGVTGCPCWPRPDVALHEQPPALPGNTVCPQVISGGSAQVLLLRPRNPPA